MKAKIKITVILLSAFTLQSCSDLNNMAKSLNKKLDNIAMNLCKQNKGSEKLCGKGTVYGDRRLKNQKEFARQTHNEVIKIGTKICEVNYLWYRYYSAGYTEKFENNKIQIRKTSDDKIIWDNPNNWFQCEL